MMDCFGYFEFVYFGYVDVVNDQVGMVIIVEIFGGIDFVVKYLNCKFFEFEYCFCYICQYGIVINY